MKLYDQNSILLEEQIADGHKKYVFKNSHHTWSNSTISNFLVWLRLVTKT